jgi:protein O-mannosyl-transferase
VVQRMALLAATFVLAGLVLYLCGRERLERGQGWQGFLLIYLGYIVGAGVGTLSKENAALFVLLVPLLEWLCFSRDRVPMAWLLRLTLILPALLLVAAVASRWPSFAEQYQTFRDFTLSERLLSQGRALGYYLWRYLLPGVGYIGIYADGFAKSTGWLAPASTLIWWLFHLALMVLAVLLRRRLPMLSLGILFFYVAHLMESSVVPLELFFEHRSYLPSALLLLGLLHVPVLSRPVVLVAGIVVLASLVLLRLQASYWGDERLLKAIMMVENPASERAVITYVQHIQREGNHAEALELLRGYAERYPAGIEIAVNVVRLGCVLRRDTADDVQLLLESPAKYRAKAPFVVTSVAQLAGLQTEGRCQTLTLEDLDRFADHYLVAYPRDAMATQGYHVSKAHLHLFRGNYTGFQQQSEIALALWPNRELALGLCWQMHLAGQSADACGCFDSQAPMFDSVSNTNRSALRSLAGYSQSLRERFLSRRATVCGISQDEEQHDSGD